MISRSTPTVKPNGTHNIEDVMVPPVAIEPNPVPVESAQPPAPDLAITSIMRSPFTAGFLDLSEGH